MAVVRRKIPSQAASGAETFSDNLVGNQITDGSSQLTNTNFDIERVIPEKDSKDFKTQPFSDFITLKDILTLNKLNDIDGGIFYLSSCNAICLPTGKINDASQIEFARQESITYMNKYLKYKNKYLNLKKKLI